MDQPKVERMLRLMQYLTGNVNYTIDDLTDKLEMSKRTIYRYFDTFRSAGFVVQRISEGVYRMANYRRQDIDLSKIVYFSDEEAYVVGTLIEELDSTNAMKQGLKRKLAAVYDSTNIGDYIGNKGNSATIGSLATAIRDKKCVTLHQYASSHSGKVRDYTVEPFRFNTNYIDFWAFDTGDGANKRFKVDRIGEVEVLEEDWSHEAAHHAAPTDSFRVGGEGLEKAIHVKLKMNLTAKNLMTENYPLSQREISQGEDGSWYYEGDVYGMDGIGRFVMSQIDSIEILEGNLLKAFLLRQSDYIRNALGFSPV